MSTKTVTVAETRPEIQFAKVGQPAPDFDLPSTKNLETLAENVKLSDYKGKWLILLFYPLDFTFVCPTELTAFSDRIDEIRGVGAEVIGISTDSVFSHRAWLKTPREQNGIEGLKFPLASDVGGRLAAKYNILVEDKMVALRGLFIIDPEGILRYAVVHDLNIGRSVDETLRVLQALQTGGLCAADWKPGQETLKV
ncbi:MAG: peroxiredoxin [Acidobacteria bacterium]|jgi:peroxiredoxin (alkyl hydroperoxide reductase subunit C)|nr:MAG: peroxiredoxin [Acidobacteriota bacterium]GIU81298.1 MAG: peroxiredoxin [Pyrinomonadaceae bacterium]